MNDFKARNEERFEEPQRKVFSENSFKTLSEAQDIETVLKPLEHWALVFQFMQQLLQAALEQLLDKTENETGLLCCC